MYIIINIAMVLDDRIPCEICNNLIQFDGYIEHVEQCYITSQIEGVNRHMTNLGTRPRQPRATTNTNVTTRHSNPTIEDIGSVIEEDMGSFLSFVSSNMNNLSVNIDSNDIDSVERVFRLEINGNDDSNSSYSFDTDFTNVISLLPVFFNQDNNYEFNLQLQEQMGGDVSVGVDSLSNCYDLLDGERENDHSERCCICLETPGDKRTNDGPGDKFVETKCKHIYCQKCIDEWLTSHHTCPVCVYDFNGKKN